MQVHPTLQMLTWTHRTAWWCMVAGICTKRELAPDQLHPPLQDAQQPSRHLHGQRPGERSVAHARPCRGCFWSFTQRQPHMSLSPHADRHYILWMEELCVGQLSLAGPHGARACMRHRQACTWKADEHEQIWTLPFHVPTSICPFMFPSQYAPTTSSHHHNLAPLSELKLGSRTQPKPRPRPGRLHMRYASRSIRWSPLHGRVRMTHAQVVDAPKRTSVGCAAGGSDACTHASWRPCVPTLDGGSRGHQLIRRAASQAPCMRASRHHDDQLLCQQGHSASATESIWPHAAASPWRVRSRARARARVARCLPCHSSCTCAGRAPARLPAMRGGGEGGGA